MAAQRVVQIASDAARRPPRVEMMGAGFVEDEAGLSIGRDTLRKTYRDATYAECAGPVRPAVRGNPPGAGAIEAPEGSESMERIASLEQEVEALETALYEQQSFIMQGYIVHVWPGEEGPVVATCPTLHAVAEGETQGAALDSLREAMQVAIEGDEDFGIPVPPPDVEARCIE